ncbi:uncharacterized protein [Miscanthus floridulus]|uniref:uncharacterized protein isoform X2 n=1 Tax=Miscanthus floridulus TaxID=154761 RepID=UPI0034583B7D
MHNYVIMVDAKFNAPITVWLWTSKPLYQLHLSSRSVLSSGDSLEQPLRPTCVPLTTPHIVAPCRTLGQRQVLLTVEMCSFCLLQARIQEGNWIEYIWIRGCQNVDFNGMSVYFHHNLSFRPTESLVVYTLMEE